MRTTGPSTEPSSLSGSKRRARSCRKGSMSEGPRSVGEEEETERRGAARVEREMRGATSSSGPMGLLGEV